jgi:hypothetical protein
MKPTIFKISDFVLLFVLISSGCKKDSGDNNSIKLGNGNVWLSGGLPNCAEQIHLDNGDALIVNLEDVKSFISGDRVSVKYKEIGVNKVCSPGIDCEIVEIKKVPLSQ